MLQHLFRFSFILLLVVGITYVCHSYLNNRYFDASPELLNFAYKFNAGITLIFTTSIILATEKLKEQLGFIFLLGGAIKLGIFAYLIKTSDITLSKSLFLHFFVPYVVCVVLEIFYVIKLLNAANFRNSK